mgnify:FL=1
MNTIFKYINIHKVTKMDNLPRYLQFEIIKFITPRWFVNYPSINKVALVTVKEYLKYKKNIYESEKICKTYKNCLYKLQDNYGFEDEENLIIKIVYIEPINEDKKYKITFWVLSKMKKVGKLPVSYPDWTIIKGFEQDNFIPFY